MEIRVTTFNIQHGRNHNLEGDVIDLPLMAQNALDTGAVVFGFNEVRKGLSPDIPKFPDTPAILGSLIGGEHIFGGAISLGEGKLYGNALVSKYPIVESEVIPIPDPEVRTGRQYYESRCIIRALIDCEGVKVTFIATHFGLNPDERNNAADVVLGIVRGCKTPVVFMGDLNTTPDDPVYARLAAELVDAASFTGNEEYTFSSDSPHERIDYIFVRGFVPVEAHAVKKIVSDHYALTALLRTGSDTGFSPAIKA